MCCCLFKFSSSVLQTPSVYKSVAPSKQGSLVFLELLRTPKPPALPPPGRAILRFSAAEEMSEAHRMWEGASQGYRATTAAEVLLWCQGRFLSMSSWQSLQYQGWLLFDAFWLVLFRQNFKEEPLDCFEYCFLVLEVWGSSTLSFLLAVVVVEKEEEEEGRT